MCAKKKTEKKPVSPFAAFPVFLNRFFPLFVVVLFFSNLILVWRVFESTRPKIIVQYHETTNTIYRVLSVTQWLDSVSSDVSDSSPVSDFKEEVINANFDYFEINGVPGFRYLDRIFYVGSNTSLGQVLDIYPDKVVCTFGSFVLARSSFSDVRQIEDGKKIKSPWRN